MSRAVSLERIWVTARSKRSAACVPFAGAHGRRGIQTLGAIQLAYGLVVFDRHRERSSSLQVATCWYLDCVVLLFGAVKQSDSELGALGVLAEVWSANPANGAWLLAC